MRPLSYLTIPMALLVAACEGPPVAPERGVRPQFEATHGESTTTFNFVDDPADCTANSRIGEVVLFTGQITYVERTTTTSSGNANVSWYFIYDPAVHVVGQTSGTVWMIDATSTHPTGHSNVHGAGSSSENLANEFYTNVNGAHLHLIGNYHLTVDANGNIAATRPFVWQCIGG
jgi:hypothetical protein